MTIWTPDQPILPEQYLAVRNAAARAFDDQKVAPYKPRLPVIFCQFKDPAVGLTIEGSEWPRYCILDGFSRNFNTLIHEIGHAAGLQHTTKEASPGNVMIPGVPNLTALTKAQLLVIEKAYFVI
jgi:hypothetical protein